MLTKTTSTLNFKYVILQIVEDKNKQLDRVVSPAITFLENISLNFLCECDDANLLLFKILSYL